MELRTEAYLADPVFNAMKEHGVGVVFSHWTWLPPLRKQLAKEYRGQVLFVDIHYLLKSTLKDKFSRTHRKEEQE